VEIGNKLCMEKAGQCLDIDWLGDFSMVGIESGYK